MINKWTQEEDIRVEELFKTKTAKEIGVIMGKSYASIFNRIRFIKQKRLDDFYTDVKRKCPKCGKNTIHTNKMERDRSEKRNASCRECKGDTQKISMLGERNPFYGRKHSPETCKKIREKNSCRKLSKEHNDALQNGCRKFQESGKRKHFYDSWLEKYGPCP